MIDDSFWRRLDDQERKLKQLLNQDFSYVNKFEKYLNSTSFQNTIKKTNFSQLYFDKVNERIKAFDRIQSYNNMNSLTVQALKINNLVSNPALQYLNYQDSITNKAVRIQQKYFGDSLNLALSDKYLSNIQTTMDNLTVAISQTNLSSLFKDITINDIEELDESKMENTSVAADIDVDSHKKVSNLTIDEFKEVIDKAFQESSKKERSPQTFLEKVLESIVINQTIQISIIIFQVFLGLFIGIAQGNHDMSVKTEVERAISQSNYSKIYNIFKENIVGERPYANLGYLRVTTFVREGPKKTTPLAMNKVIQSNTVVTLLERKGNWIEVQIDEEEACYVGWVEESKVIKFK